MIFVFLSLIFLIFLHEIGHFLFAKIFKVRVKELGLFLPPRIFSKRIGQTVFSINLLPFGAFLRLYGERKRKKEPGSFSALPVLKRILIVLGGAISFWLISIFLTFFVFHFGIPVPISDEKSFPEAKVQILQVFPNSPAFSKLFPGDEILEISGEKINKAIQVKEIVEKNLGKEIFLRIKRGEKILDISLVPRISPPEGQGPLGILISKTKIEKYSIFESAFKAPVFVFKTTFKILEGYFVAIKDLFLKRKIDFAFVGPVGISYFLWQTEKLGPIYFLNLLSLISIHLAIFNLLPIPALDGGKILFLIIEGIRKKPISKKIEEKINLFFFLLLMSLIFFVTIFDIKRIF